MIRVVRIYAVNKMAFKGYSILIDRLWPRGIKKADLKMDVWMKELAPSILLRKWFNHDPDKWKEFRLKYKIELKEKMDDILKVKELEIKHKVVVLLFAAKDIQHNHALVLKEVIDKYAL